MRILVTWCLLCGSAVLAFGGGTECSKRERGMAMKSDFGRFLGASFRIPTDTDLKEFLAEKKISPLEAVDVSRAVLNCRSLRSVWPAAVFSLGALADPGDSIVIDELVSYLAKPAPDTAASRQEQETYWFVQAKLQVPEALALLAKRRQRHPDRQISAGQENPEPDKAFDTLAKLAAVEGAALDAIRVSGVDGAECAASTHSLRVSAIRALAELTAVRPADVDGALADVARGTKDPTLQAEVERVRARQ